MGRRPKFKPEIVKVKLNPEQAVLSCSCYTSQYWSGSGHRHVSSGQNFYCSGRVVQGSVIFHCDGAGGALTAHGKYGGASS